MARFLRFIAPLAPLLCLTAALAQPAPGVAQPAPASAAAASAAPLTPPALRAPLVPAFPVQEIRLANGLQVLLAPDDSLPNVAVVVQYHVGSADEPQGLSGIAHLVEHLTFVSSAHVPRGAHLRILADAGATDLNGQTGPDSTYYHEVVPPERLELALWLESDRMGYFLPAVDEAALEQERSVVLTELRTRVNDEPAGILPLVTFEATYPSWHPYHDSVEGDAEDTKKITLADIRAFFGTWYGPANATLVLAGRFDRERGRALVERYFGSLSGRPPPQRPALPPLERKGPTRVEVGAAVGEESVHLTWVTPAFGAPGDAALDWVSALLGRGRTSRLQKRLVDDGLAVSVAVRQASKKRASTFMIRATGLSGRRAEELTAAIDQELSRLAAIGPSPLEMERAGAYWEVADLFDLEKAIGRAGALTGAVARGPLPLPFDWREHRGAVFTAADIKDAVTRYLAPAARAAEVIVRPKRGAPLAGTIVKKEEP